jgi:hypothetical protein
MQRGRLVIEIKHSPARAKTDWFWKVCVEINDGLNSPVGRLYYIFRFLAFDGLACRTSPSPFCYDERHFILHCLIVDCYVFINRSARSYQESAGGDPLMDPTGGSFDPSLLSWTETSNLLTSPSPFCYDGRHVTLHRLTADCYCYVFVNRSARFYQESAGGDPLMDPTGGPLTLHYYLGWRPPSIVYYWFDSFLVLSECCLLCICQPERQILSRICRWGSIDGSHGGSFDPSLLSWTGTPLHCFIDLICFLCSVMMFSQMFF